MEKPPINVKVQLTGETDSPDFARLELPPEFQLVAVQKCPNQEEHGTTVLLCVPPDQEIDPKCAILQLMVMAERFKAMVMDEIMTEAGLGEIASMKLKALTEDIDAPRH